MGISVTMEENSVKKIAGLFIRGLLVLAPLAVTIFILYQLFKFADGLFKGMLLKVGFYFPGLGMLMTVAFIFLAGVLASNWLTKGLLRYFEALLIRFPILGKIYGIIKDTLQSFTVNRKGLTRLVVISLPNEMKLLGFQTAESDGVVVPQGYVAIYLMQSMQWAGNLVLVPEGLVEPLDVTPEEALKFIASAGLLKVNRSN